MITLTLLHPIQSTPVQHWTFEHEPIVRIGRSTDNHVILYSAVVSRHHVELRRTEAGWDIVNLGANGTYVDGRQVSQLRAVDGVVIRLARSGPNIQIHLSPTAEPAGEKTMGQRGRAAESRVERSTDPPPLTRPPQVALDGFARSQAAAAAQSQARSQLPSDAEEVSLVPPQATLDELQPRRASRPNMNCQHQRALPDMMFCPDCGQPMRVLQTLGDYQILQTLQEEGIGLMQLGWRNGQSLLIKTLSREAMNQPEAIELFEQQARSLLPLTHPGMPRFVDFFMAAGQPYLVREQVYGENLHQRVQTAGPLAIDRAIAVMQQVCDLLDYLHHQSPPFVHQDLRPENLIQRRSPSDEQIMVTGFVSLAALKVETQPLLNGYNAPEQQQGYATPACDLYALGPILVYLLTGEEPHAYYTHREQGFRFYPEYVPGLLPDIGTIVRRLTNPNPADRYANAKEVADALAQVSTVDPVAEKL